MKFTKLGLLVAGLFLSSAILAGNTLRSSSISLGGGTVKPGETLSISTDQFIGDAKYDVVCRIKDTNNAKNHAYIRFSYWANYEAQHNKMNGRDVSTQAKLDQVSNLLELSPVTRNTSIEITNLDKDDTIEVESCVATPSNW